MQPVPTPMGPGLALAVYAIPQGEGFATLAAADTGFEGVACVDDAARALLVYATIWRRWRQPWARQRALGLSAFVRGMQQPDGSFCNFVLDWQGSPNRTGLTSVAGTPSPWTLRALHGLAFAAAALDDAECREAFRAGCRWLAAPTPHMDLRAVAVLAALAAEPLALADSLPLLDAWCDEIAATHNGAVLLNHAAEPVPHLWGHLQEAALATAGRTRSVPAWVAAARDSADALLAPAASHRLPTGNAVAFDVSCVALGLDAVARVTADPAYGRTADLARAWFWGRNAAHQPVYNTARGLVHDGIDHGALNAGSGAESNIEGALALLNRTVVSAGRR